MPQYLLAIDQGTTNSRALIFDQTGQVKSAHQISLTQFFPHPGWVEQNAEEMLQNTILCCRTVLQNARIAANEIAAIGVANQRETTIIWDKNTGKPVYNAIVWQDRRTSELCAELAAKNLQVLLRAKTGLLLDPYFSATKIMWLLDHVPGVRARAEKGELLFGTVDSFLLWHLSRQKIHATDATNASRTMLFNIYTQQWDAEILTLLNIPGSLLPQVQDNAADFGDLDEAVLGTSIPIAGMAGDQQAALIGQACFTAGMVKATYGTGAFILLNTGSTPPQAAHQLVTTIAYRLNNQVTYGVEGSIFSAGTTVKWLRDTLHLIETAEETETLARMTTTTEGVYLVPAFTGLGAPYWNPEARGAILGLTRNSGKPQIVRAALESVAYQTRDLLAAITGETGLKALRVDGGMTANTWLLQFIADMLQVDVYRPTSIETTALGVAFLAGLQTGIYQSLSDIIELWQMAQHYQPKMTAKERDILYSGWQAAVQRVM